MATETVFKRFDELTEDERATLRTLTLTHERGMRSLFWEWLAHPMPSGYYAAFVRDRGAMIAWAGASTLVDWAYLMIGVYVLPEYRSRGYARLALDALMTGLTEQCHDAFSFIQYQEGLEPWVQSIVERHGWKDLSREECKAEYTQMAQEREMRAIAHRRSQA